MDATLYNNYEAMYGVITSYLRFYVEEYRLKSLVLGLSGGVDSALVAAVARPVCEWMIMTEPKRKVPISIPRKVFGGAFES